MKKKRENISYLSRCKICGNDNLKKVVKLNEQYISGTFVESNEKSYLKKIKTPLTLSLCVRDDVNNNCGHLQLYEITNPDLLYKKYFYRSATSDTMKNDLKNVVESVLRITKPEQKDIIVDIGSNDCTLLNFYKKEFKLVGFEPAENIKYILRDEGFSFAYFQKIQKNN